MSTCHQELAEREAELWKVLIAHSADLRELFLGYGIHVEILTDVTPFRLYFFGNYHFKQSQMAVVTERFSRAAWSCREWTEKHNASVSVEYDVTATPDFRRSHFLTGENALRFKIEDMAHTLSFYGCIAPNLDPLNHDPRTR